MSKTPLANIPAPETIESLKEVITKLQAELQQRYTELAIIQKHVLEGGSEDAASEAAKRSAAEVQLEAIKKSTSWRITAPLRRVRKRLPL
jgi:hypothetical protein